MYFTGAVEAGNIEFGERIGYGVMKYEESSSADGTETESESTLRMFLLEVSGEYTFSKPQNFFIGVTAEWAGGSEDEETWEENGVEVQKNDLRIFGQFYDIRIGYNKSNKRFYYGLYAAGGWDSIHFERDNFISSGTEIRNEITEDFSLWRTGGGIVLGYKFGKWALAGTTAYAFYPEGEGKNSAQKEVEYDTEGERLDVKIGITREIAENLNLNFGGGYTVLDLDINETEDKVNQTDSRIQIVAGVIELTYSF
jgi:hypothetical protein